MDEKISTKAAPKETMVVSFGKPYTFEGTTYNEVDLAGLDDLSTDQLCQADRIFERGGGVSTIKELNVEYACIIAAMATGKPVEFFKGLPARDGNKIKAKVGAYFFGAG